MHNLVRKINSSSKFFETKIIVHGSVCSPQNSLVLENICLVNNFYKTNEVEIAEY